MTKTEIINAIRDLKGATVMSISALFPDEPPLILKQYLNSLQNNGEISFWKGKYYPVTRAIGIVEKGGEDAQNEIELPGLLLDEIKHYFKALPDDPLYYYGYDITETQHVLIIHYTDIKFDFEKYDYYLCT